MFAAGIISCAQKLPVPNSNEEGMLVIAVETSYNIEEEFGYNYIIVYSPETPVKIKILPNTGKKFYVFSSIPVGSYRVRAVTAIGLRDQYMRANMIKKERPLWGDSFIIKPNQVTLLKSKFVISVEDVADGRWTQKYKFQDLDDQSKIDITNQLKKLKNSQHWKFQY